MSLKVTVKNTTKLPDLQDEQGSLDPYVAVKFRGQKKSTAILDDTLTPEWNTTLEWTLKSPLNPNEEIILKVYDRLALNRRRTIGELNYSVAKLMDQEVQKESLRLKPSLKDIKKDNWEKFRLNVDFHYQIKTSTFVKQESSAPSNFQIRVYVFEARILEGYYISPAITVTCNGLSQSTVAKPLTNNPVYNEMKTFYLEVTPTQLSSKEVQFRVRDEESQLSSEIGYFSINVGSVYNEPDHTIFSKWLVLGEPSNSFTRAKGFLCVSVSVIGPNDDPVYLSPETKTMNLDIESNLVRSSNVKLQQAVIRTRLYLAKDIPKVDPASISDTIKTVFTGKSDLHSADPYVTVTYNGQTGQSSVKSRDQNPVWNEQVDIGFSFPSICDKIVLQVKDKDGFFSADDYIGTCVINVPDIAVHGRNGFLPSFGPSYINMYGSPLEFSLFPDKHDDMNKGKVEGVAYRGRLLLEIDTHLGPLKKPFQSIETDVQQKLGKFVGIEKDYALYAVFNGASMIKDTSSRYKFEVSIGTHRQVVEIQNLNKDGSGYLSVNWGDHKPLVEVISKWEDCSGRINTFNIFVNHVNHLELCFAKFEETEVKKTVEQLRKLSNQFQESLRSCQSTLNKVSVQPSPTKLDHNLRQHRLNELSDIILAVESLKVGKKSNPNTIYERLIILLNRFKYLSNDPQISIPDVIVCLLTHNNTRVSSCRIPAASIMHSPISIMTGRMCGKLQTIQLKSPGDTENHDLCFVEMSLCFGLKEHKDNFLQNCLHSVYGDSLKVDHKNQKLILEESASKYELRAYMYQARDLYAGDILSGLSDPYCTISFCGATARTKTVKANLSPKWNQTIVLKDIEQHTKLEAIPESPFIVSIKLFDEDKFGKDDYLGTLIARPSIILTAQSPLASLQWHAVSRFGENVGELLAGFELIKIDQPGFTPEVLDGSKIPNRFLPKSVPKVVKVQVLGLQQMDECMFFPVHHPFIKVQCEDEEKCTGVLGEGDCMFPSRNLELDLNLPDKDIFSPPLNLLVHDKRMFGYSPLVGSHSIRFLNEFENNTIDGKQLYRIANPLIHPEASIKGGITQSSDYDWWSKYYSSIGDMSKVQEKYPENPEHKLTVFPSELEAMFHQFSDIVKTFPLFRGKGKQTIENSSPVGYLKGIVSVNDKGSEPTALIPTGEDGIPNIYPQKMLVRVYVVKGINLKPLDIAGGKSDPYIEVSVDGQPKQSTVYRFIPNDSDPLFGEVFEFDAVLPSNRMLTVTIKDHDYLGRNDIIGSTTIDLENRFLSGYRAFIGIPRSFSISGLNAWRDFLTPVDILNNLCSMQGRSIDWSVDHRTVNVNEYQYELDDFEDASIADGNEQHRLALHVLHQQELVPEHVETRTLYKDSHPNIPQGQLHMWVDIMPRTRGVIAVPPKVDIAPRKPIKYVLRVVVWGVADVCMPARQLTCDYFVSSILNSGMTQKTDIHYFAFGREGKFNWRFVYPFDYDPITKRIVYKEKDHFYSFDHTQHTVEDSIVFQVWDNDFFSSNDFLGKVEFSLHNAPIPAPNKNHCNLQTLGSRINLFKRGINNTAKGWLPIYKGEGEERQCTGKLNVWFEMLTEEEANLHPAGVGREEPNQYPELRKPDRPLLKFNFYDSALKTFKFSIWKNHKCLVLCVVLCLVLLVVATVII